MAGSGKCIWTGLTIPLLQCTRTSEVVRRRGDHPTKTGGRPNPKTGRRPSHVRRDNGTSLRQNRKQSVHLKRAALYKGYSPNSSEASFCVSLPVWLVQQGRQRGRCPQGLAKNTYWDTAVPRQSVHLKRAALQTVLKQSIPNECIMFGAVSALRADLTTHRMVFGNLDWGTQPTAGGAGVDLRKRVQ